MVRVEGSRRGEKSEREQRKWKLREGKREWRFSVGAQRRGVEGLRGFG